MIRRFLLIALIGPLVFHTNAHLSNTRDANELQARLNVPAKLTFLAPEGSDGTILVSLDDDEPPFKVTVLDLILNLKIQAPSDGFVVGSTVDVDVMALHTIPKITSSDGWTRGSRTEPLLRFVRTSDVRQKTLDDSEESLHRQEKGKTSKGHGALRSNYYADGGTFAAAQLLNISYEGKSRLQVGDTLKWKISVLQGAAPLALIIISLMGPFYPPLTVQKKFYTPIGFGDNSTQILEDVVTFTITKPVLDGSYSHASIGLETQPCPLHMSTEIYPSFAYAMAGGGVGTASAGSQRYLNAFALPTLIFGSGQPPTITPALLLSFAMESDPVVSIGGEMRWNYTVQLGTYPLASVTLEVQGPQLLGGQFPQSFGSRSITVPVGASGRADAGTVVAGKISVPVTAAWIPGAYNFAGSYPALTLTVAAPPPFTGTTRYNMGGSGSSQPYNPQYASLSVPSFSLSALAFVVTASRPTPALAAPQLLSLQYTGPAEVRAGDEMTWEYAILQVRVCVYI